MAMVSTEQTAKMERAIAALALEIPGEVWEDVRDKWHAARDSMSGRYFAVVADLSWCLGYIKEAHGGELPEFLKQYEDRGGNAPH